MSRPSLISKLKELQVESMRRELEQRYEQEMKERVFYGERLIPIQEWAERERRKILEDKSPRYESWKWIDEPEAPRKERKPKPPPRTEGETKTQFERLMLDAGLGRITLPLKERIEHEMQLGEPEEFKKREPEKQEEDKPIIKRLCPICADPRCPWSD